MMIGFGPVIGKRSFDWADSRIKATAGIVAGMGPRCTLAAVRQQKRCGLCSRHRTAFIRSSTYTEKSPLYSD